jgi:hypothetical protein
MRSLRPSRRSVVRLLLRTSAAAGAVLLTVALSEQGSRSAFTAATGDGGNHITAAADFCGNPAPVVVTASADTSVAQARDESTLGTYSSLYVWAKNNDNVRALVRFALPSRPVGCTLVGASLQLYNSVPQTGRVIEALRLDPANNWGETTVRWGTIPAIMSGAATSTTTAAVGWQTWNVLPQVTAQSTGNISFLVKDATETGVGSTMQTYSSREGTQPPKLTITWG